MISTQPPTIRTLSLRDENGHGITKRWLIYAVYPNRWLHSDIETPCLTSHVSPSRLSSHVSRQKIAQTAQAILNARARYPESSLAYLYDPLTMPPDLRAAHEANDRAVLAAYGLAPDTPEPEIVAHLFKLYAEKMEEEK